MRLLADKDSSPHAYAQYEIKRQVSMQSHVRAELDGLFALLVVLG